MNCTICNYSWCWVCGLSLYHWSHVYGLNIVCEMIQMTPAGNKKWLFYLIYFLGLVLGPPFMIILGLCGITIGGVVCFLEVTSNCFCSYNYEENREASCLSKLFCCVFGLIFAPIWLCLSAAFAVIVVALGFAIGIIPFYVVGIVMFIRIQIWWRKKK